MAFASTGTTIATGISPHRVVGHADDRSVRDDVELVDHVFDLLGVDVEAAGDYLKLLAAKRDAELGGHRIDYASLTQPDGDGEARDINQEGETR